MPLDGKKYTFLSGALGNQFLDLWFLPKVPWQEDVDDQPWFSLFALIWNQNNDVEYRNHQDKSIKRTRK